MQDHTGTRLGMGLEPKPREVEAGVLEAWPELRIGGIALGEKKIKGFLGDCVWCVWVARERERTVGTQKLGVTERRAVRDRQRDTWAQRTLVGAQEWPR